MPGRILIVDEVATNRILLKVRLSSACYEVMQADCGRQAQALARGQTPDLILIDQHLSDIDGISLCQRLKADPATAPVPVVIIAAQADRDARFRALQAGADDFLPKQLDEQTLLARMRSLLRTRDITEELRLRDDTCRDLGLAEDAAGFDYPARVALIAAREQTAQTWKSALQDRLSDRIEVLRKETVLATGGDDAAVPDIYVIAGDLADPGGGLRLLSELRSRPVTRHAAVLMVLSEGARGQAAMALDLGANDLLVAGFDPDELALRLTRQIRRKREADRLRETVRDGLRAAVIDPLTGLYNRRYAQPHLARIATRAVETGRHFALMVLDLDRFKDVNDTHGHATGDAVLREVARRVKRNLRSVDLVARIGGEEFLVAMPDTTLPEARRAAERLCRVICETPVQMPEAAGGLTVSVSIGVAMGGGAATTDVDLLLSQADKALYGAKSDGRNQVTISRSAA